MELESLYETVKKNEESLTYAQTWVILIIIGMVGYLIFKGIREFYFHLQKVDEERSLQDEIDYLYDEIQALMSMCIKQEEKEQEDFVFIKEEEEQDLIGLSLSPTGHSAYSERSENKKQKQKGKKKKKQKLAK